MARRLTDAERLDRAMSENDLLVGVLDLARLRRWLSWHVRRSDKALSMGDPGVPDLLLCRPPRLLAVELKRELAAPGPPQDRWLNALRGSGVEVYVWRPSDWRTGAIDEVLA